jgi:hypothetical protein
MWMSVESLTPSGFEPWTVQLLVSFSTNYTIPATLRWPDRVYISCRMWLSFSMYFSNTCLFST